MDRTLQHLVGACQRREALGGEARARRPCLYMRPYPRCACSAAGLTLGLQSQFVRYSGQRSNEAGAWTLRRRLEIQQHGEGRGLLESPLLNSATKYVIWQHARSGTFTYRADVSQLPSALRLTLVNAPAEWALPARRDRWV